MVSRVGGDANRPFFCLKFRFLKEIYMSGSASNQIPKKTPLYEQHLKSNGKMVIPIKDVVETKVEIKE